MLKDKMLVLEVNGRQRRVDIKEIGTLVPFRYSGGDPPNTMSLDVVAEGSTQVLRLTKYNQARSLFRPNPARRGSSRGGDGEGNQWQGTSLKW